jgi:hypothetical protein
MYKIFINWSGCSNQLDFDTETLDEAIETVKGEMRKWGKVWGDANGYIFGEDGKQVVISLDVAGYKVESASDYFKRIKEYSA